MIVQTIFTSSGVITSKNLEEIEAFDLLQSESFDALFRAALRKA